MDQQALLFKLAHISDLHFSKVHFSVPTLFSKEFIGNLNLLLSRRKTYKNDKVASLVETLKKEQVTHVLFTGDLSTTSSEKEFEKAKEFIDLLKKEKMEVIAIPGNHDNYTKRAEKKKLFYQYMQEHEKPFLGYQLQTHKVAAHFLGDNVWVVTIDTTFACPVYRSCGKYDEQIDRHLKALLSSIPPSDTIIFMNHFPLFDVESQRRSMQGSEILRKTLSQFPNVKLYLHGHTHKPSILDHRKENLPIVADSGSLSHVKKGSWHTIEIYESRCAFTTYKPTDMHKWAEHKNLSFTW